MKYLHKAFNLLQSIGRALWLPIAVLPAAGLLLRLGQPDLLNTPFLAQAGGAIFAKLGLLFAIGVAGGISVDKNISAGLSGAIIYLVMRSAMLTIDANNDMGTLGGIIAGLSGGYCYNKFYMVKLPVYLSFFGGRRFVPIISGFVAIILAGIFGFVWPSINKGIIAFSDWIISSGSVGLFTYGISNRILLPTGLQHITEAMTYFVLGNFTAIDGSIITGDMNRFFAKDPSAGIFMAGFFPVMIFGLPAAALAIYTTAKKENKPLIVGILLSGALTSMLTGVTEPIEFPILFSAPLLFGVHAIMMGVSYVVANLVGYKAGFTFSGGIIDLILSWGISTKPWLIFILGPIFSLSYYLIFYFLIKIFNLKTPGREDDIGGESVNIANMFEDTTYDEKAQNIFKALGGKDNVLVIDNCISRLRLQLKDVTIINEVALKQAGAKGVIKSGNNVQIVIDNCISRLRLQLKDVTRINEVALKQAGLRE